MKVKEIRDKQTDAIQLELEQLQRRLFDLRNQSATEKVEDTSQFRKARRSIAQMKTILKQRQDALAAQAPAAAVSKVPAAQPQ
jgi:large subunit ribosomal protein L29